MARSRELRIQISGDARSLNRALGSADRNLGSFDSRTKRVAKSAALALAGMGTAAVGAGAKMINLASDAEETASKFKTVFGRETNQAIKQLDAFSKATGTSRFALREQAAQLQALIRPMGLTVNRSSDMSVGLTRLATDLASFNNTDVQTAITALQSGLVGEAEPLRKFGVQLSAARVETFAYAEGIAKQGEELNAAQKAQAAYGIILEDTKLAQGDAERTAGSFANQFKRLKAQVTDTATELGVKMLPAARAAVGAITQFIRELQTGEGFGGRFRDTVVSAFERVKTVAQGVVGAFQTIVSSGAAMAGLGAIVGTLVGAFVASKVIAFTTAIQAMSVAIRANPVGILVTAIGAALGALGLFSVRTREAKTSQDQFREAILGVRDAIDRFRDADAGVADAQLRRREAEVALAEAVRRRRDLEKDGTATALQKQRADLDVARAGRELAKSTKEVERAQRDQSAVEQQAIGDARRNIEVLKARARTIENALPLHRTFTLEQIAAGKGGNDLRRVMVQLKEEQLRLARATGRSGDVIARLKREIATLNSKRIKVNIDVNVAPGPAGQGARPGDGWGVTDAAKSAIAAGFKAGKFAAPVSGTGLNAFNAIAQMFGLRIGSGFRKGSRTTSGNVSYHALGRARDFPGSPSQMMAFARYMAAAFGSRLKELIYTPLGFSIKDGQRVAPYARAQHFDHVHVAMRKGGMIPGVGDGDKIPALLEPGEFVVNRRATSRSLPFLTALNERIARFQSGGVVGKVAGAARGAGFAGASLKHAIAVALAESGGRLTARNNNPPIEDSRGPWQVNVLAHPWARGLSTYAQWAKAAFRISKGGRDWSPWSVWPGKARGFFGVARQAAINATRGGASPGGSAPTTRGGFLVDAPRGGPVEDTDFSQPLPDLPTDAPGSKPRPKGRPSLAKGRGMIGDEAAEVDVPSATDFLDRDLALAQLTSDTADDLAALTAQKSYWESELAKALTTADPRDDIRAAQGLKGVTDAIASLDGTIQEQERFEREKHEAIKQLADELKRQNDFGESVMAVTSREALRFMADMLNGEIVGRGIVPRAATAGAGTVARY